MTVLDLSNYSYDAAIANHGSVQNWMSCLKLRGVERIIVNGWDLEKSRAMIRGARAAGIACEDIYCFLYYGLPWERHEVDNALILKMSEGLLGCWLDQESHWRPDTPTEAQGTTVGYRIATTAKLRVELIKAGLHPGQYTGASWWNDNMGNFDGFAVAGDPLWLANYGSNDPTNPLPPILEVNFGGWTHTYAHQFSSTISECGRQEDHNYWNLESTAMTPEEKTAFKALTDKVTRLEAITAGNGTFPVVAREGNMAALSKGNGEVFIKLGALYTLTGEQTLRYLQAQGNNAYLGLANLQRDFALLAAEVDNLEVYGGDPVQTSAELTALRYKYEAIAEGISALDDVLESLRTGDGDTDPKVS